MTKLELTYKIADKIREAYGLDGIDPAVVAEEIMQILAAENFLDKRK